MPVLSDSTSDTEAVEWSMQDGKVLAGPPGRVRVRLGVCHTVEDPGESIRRRSIRTKIRSREQSSTKFKPRT